MTRYVTSLTATVAYRLLRILIPGDLPQMAWVYFVLGNVRIDYRTHLSEDGILYMMRSIDISERTGNVQMQAMAYSFLGSAYSQIREDEKAIENFDKSMFLSEETGSLFPMTQHYQIMEIYANQSREDMVNSSFSRIMNGFSSLDIDEESQLRVLFIKSYIGPEAAYERFRNCYDTMGKDAEFPHMVRKILGELVAEVESRPQKVWYYDHLADLCVELGDMDNARIYAGKAVSIVQEMGQSDYTGFSYPAYLLLGEIGTAGEMAIRHLINRAQLYNAMTK